MPSSLTPAPQEIYPLINETGMQLGILEIEAAPIDWVKYADQLGEPATALAVAKDVEAHDIRRNNIAAKYFGFVGLQQCVRSQQLEPTRMYDVFKDRLADIRWGDAEPSALDSVISMLKLTMRAAEHTELSVESEHSELDPLTNIQLEDCAVDIFELLLKTDKTRAIELYKELTPYGSSHQKALITSYAKLQKRLNTNVPGDHGKLKKVFGRDEGIHSTISFARMSEDISLRYKYDATVYGSKPVNNEEVSPILTHRASIVGKTILSKSVGKSMAIVDSYIGRPMHELLPFEQVHLLNERGKKIYIQEVLNFFDDPYGGYTNKNSRPSVDLGDIARLIFDIKDETGLVALFALLQSPKLAANCDSSPREFIKDMYRDAPKTQAAITYYDQTRDYLLRGRSGAILAVAAASATPEGSALIQKVNAEHIHAAISALSQIEVEATVQISDPFSRAEQQLRLQGIIATAKQHIDTLYACSEKASLQADYERLLQAADIQNVKKLVAEII